MLIYPSNKFFLLLKFSDGDTIMDKGPQLT